MNLLKNLSRKHLLITAMLLLPTFSFAQGVNDVERLNEVFRIQKAKTGRLVDTGKFKGYYQTNGTSYNGHESVSYKRYTGKKLVESTVYIIRDVDSFYQYNISGYGYPTEFVDRGTLSISYWFATEATMVFTRYHDKNGVYTGIQTIYAIPGDEFRQSIHANDSVK